MSCTNESFTQKVLVDLVGDFEEIYGTVGLYPN